MKIINRQNFLGVVSTVFTVLVLSKVALEFFFAGVFGDYQGNLLTMFLLSFLATFVLSQHYRFEKYPLLLVIAGQYVLLIGIVMIFTWWSGRFETLSKNAYRDMFLSFTIPYFVSVVIYYAAVFHEIKCANQALQRIKEEREDEE